MIIMNIKNKYWIVKETIELMVGYPKDWTIKEIEFHRNKSSWCASNISGEIEEQLTKYSCNICHCYKSEVLREATIDDIEMRTEE